MGAPRRLCEPPCRILSCSPLSEARSARVSRKILCTQLSNSNADPSINLASLLSLRILRQTLTLPQYAAYFVLAAVLTVLTSNDVVILTLTPVIYHFSKATGIDPAPLLFLEFFTANVWSMALLIGEHMHPRPCRIPCSLRW